MVELIVKGVADAEFQYLETTENTCHPVCLGIFDRLTTLKKLTQKDIFLPHGQ